MPVHCHADKLFSTDHVSSPLAEPPFGIDYAFNAGTCRRLGSHAQPSPRRPCAPALATITAIPASGAAADA
jgi:hypothetical protein